MTCQLKATQQDDRGTKEKRKHDAYGDRGRADVRGELPLERAADLELVAGRDDPEADGAALAGADPAVHLIVLVVERVLVLVVHLPLEPRVGRVHEQHGLAVGQPLGARRLPVLGARHVPLDGVRDRHVVEPRRVELEGEPGLADGHGGRVRGVLHHGVAVEPGAATQHHHPLVHAQGEAAALAGRVVGAPEGELHLIFCRGHHLEIRALKSIETNTGESLMDRKEEEKGRRNHVHLVVSLTAGARGVPNHVPIPA
jgi:hypothetical protein